MTSFIFNELIAASVYEANIAEDSEESEVCTGTSCFFASAMLIGGLGFASSFVPLCTTWSTAKDPDATGDGAD